MNTLDRLDERKLFYVRSGGCCATCRELVFFEDMELAHKIANTKANIKRYGKEVIDHPFNRAVTHSGKCNDAQNIGFKTVAADTLASDIKTDIATPWDKR